MTRIVADLGNSRLKWSRVGPDARPGPTVAPAANDPEAWASAWDSWGLGEAGPTAWAVSSVNPPMADRLARFLDAKGVGEVRWFRSVADVTDRHELEGAETGGADRAFAVLGALARRGGRGPGLVVSCGTAVTVERIGADGIWQGGAIAPGLGPMANALHLMTAQLPKVVPIRAPEAFGRGTVSSLEAGIYWGMVGTIRELLDRQAIGLEPAPWVVWTGGDAPSFAPWIDRPGAEVVPDLVLEGLAGLPWAGS